MISKTLPGSPSVGAFLVRPGNSNQILIGTGDLGRDGDEGTGLYRTTDGGATWTRISMSPEPSHFFRLMVNPSDAGGTVVYAATNVGVFISIDFGLTWERAYTGSASLGVTDIARATSSSDWILGVPGTGVVRCSILTTILSSCTAASGFAGDISRVSVAVTPADTNWVFADRSTAHADYVTIATGGHRPSRIFLSPNRGVNWWDVTGDLADSLPNVHYWQLVVHPADNHQLFLATEVGVFRSDDSGGHWYRYMDGLPSVVKVRGIQIHATGPDDAELVIATWGHGFWERPVEFQEGALFGDGFETGSTDRWDDVVGGTP